MNRKSSHSDWYTDCRVHQQRWKQKTTTLTDSARVAGLTLVEREGKREVVGPFPICVPLEDAALNLVPGVREEALRRFRVHDLEWHGWTPGPDGRRLPSTHLLDSQVQCVNVLLSLAGDGRALMELARAAEPDAVNLVAIEDGSPVAFEWIGMADYLGEGRGRPRLRGKYCTSADFLTVVERRDGGRTGLLGEWKFTETYDRPVRYVGPGGLDRRNVYRPLHQSADSPFAIRPPIEAFFHEPHYQLLRQALLAGAMVGAGEFGIDRAVLLHCVPDGNRALLNTVQTTLTTFGDDVGEVWQQLLPGPTVRYVRVDTVGLLAATPELKERYAGLTA